MRTVIDTRRDERSQQRPSGGSEHPPGASTEPRVPLCPSPKASPRHVHSLRLPPEPFEIRAHIGGALIPEVA